MYEASTTAGRPRNNALKCIAQKIFRPAASNINQPNHCPDIRTKSMKVLQRASQFIKDDYDLLRQSAIKLELARFRGGDLQHHEWETSKVYSRHSAFSVEFFLPYTIMMLVFVIHPPFEAMRPELFHQVAARLSWAIGFAVHFWFIYQSKGWLLYFVFFPFGTLAFVASTIALYSCSFLAPIVFLDTLHAYVETETMARGLPYLKLFTLMLVVVGAIVLLSTAYRVIYGHPLFTRFRGEGILIALLPIGKRGELISVSADDHYVRVATTNGTSHIRLSFSDALELLKDSHGMQVHRSHWVNLKAVNDFQTPSKGKINLHLIDDSDIPVARSRVKELKDRLAISTVTSGIAAN